MPPDLPPMSAFVMTTVDPEQAAEEAGTDEVAALASMLARPAHVPAQRIADLDDDDEVEFDNTRSRADTGDDDDAAVLPRQRDEFTCPRCFLVGHVSRRVGAVCADCA